MTLKLCLQLIMKMYFSLKSRFCNWNMENEGVFKLYHVQLLPFILRAMGMCLCYFSLLLYLYTIYELCNCDICQNNIFPVKICSTSINIKIIFFQFVGLRNVFDRNSLLFFLPPILCLKICLPTILWTKTFLVSNFFLNSKFFVNQTFLVPVFLEQNFFLTPKFWPFLLIQIFLIWIQQERKGAIFEQIFIK